MKCCFCGEEIVFGIGNDPYPLVENPQCRCCDNCNTGVVLPARLKVMLDGLKENDKFWSE